MRGADVTQERLFSIRPTADFVPKGHPLIAVREILNHALRGMDRLFDSMYADTGRDSVPPERLLRGLVLPALYGIRSERLLCEQLGYNPRLRGGRLCATAGLSGWAWTPPPGITPPTRRTATG